MAAFRAQPDKQQIAAFYSAGEIRDGDSVTTVDAPDIRQQALSAFRWDAFPDLRRWRSEFRDRFDGHGFSANMASTRPSSLLMSG